MALFDDVNRKLESLGNSVTAIGIAAETKGADIDVETTPLDEWADAITAMPSPFKNEITLTAEGTINGITVMPEFVLPTADANDVPAGTTLKISNLLVLPFIAKKLIIPEHYINAEVNNAKLAFNTGSNLGAYDVPLEEIEFRGSGHFYGSWFPQFPRLRRVSMTNATAFSIAEWSKQLTFPTNQRDLLTFDLPNVTNLVMNYISEHPTAFRVRIDAPKVTAFGHKSASQPDGYCKDFAYAEIHLDALTDLYTAFCRNGTSNATSANIRHVYMPSLVTIHNNAYTTNVNSQNFYSLSTPQSMHLYIGPNLASVGSYVVANMQTNTSVHIPAGESTTKATLDALAIPYTQDYVIEA